MIHFHIFSSSGRIIYKNAFLILDGVQAKLATAPNLDVIEFGSHLYMEVTEPEDVSYLFKLRPAKNFGGDFVSYDIISFVYIQCKIFFSG